MQLGVTRLGVSLKKLAPDFKRLNPLSKLRELPKQNLPSLLQAVDHDPGLRRAVYFLVRDNFQSLSLASPASVPAGAVHVAGSIQTLLWKASLVFVVFGAVDLLRQKRRYQQDLKMSKQEIRDEIKEVEGNPLMKQRIRRLRRDMARRRMMHEVPTATAVIVNPTHYAVALKYEHEFAGRAAGGGQREELPGAAHPPEGHREPGSADRESAAGAGAVQDRGRRTGDPGAVLPRGGRSAGLHFQADEWQADCMRQDTLEDDNGSRLAWHRQERSPHPPRGSSFRRRCCRTGRNWACRSPCWAS